MSAIAVAMSGGVDSSAACLLLRQAGHEVVGFTFNLLPGQAASCSACGAQMARRVCNILGAKHHVLNLRDEFDRLVVRPSCEDYSRGQTPNPCTICNEQIKFGAFLRKAEELGLDGVATGHYAQIRRRDGGTWQLLRGSDPGKDQSYFLYRLGQEQLAKIWLPLGEMTKERIRELSRAAGLPTAECAESQDLCFAAAGGMRAFLLSRLGRKVAEGAITGPGGEKVGEHKGLCYYTIGQRRGLGLGGGKRLYVTGLNANTGEVTVGPEQALWCKELVAERVSWVGGPPHGLVEFRCLAQIRYKAAPAAAAVVVLSGDKARVVFDAEQRAITPGQAVVFYDGNAVLGGGRIDSANGSCQVERAK